MKRWIVGLVSAVMAIGGLTVYAYATVTANSIITAQTPNRGIQNFVQGTDSAGTFKTVYTAGANGSKCNAVVFTTNDGTAQHVMTLEIVASAVSYPVCSTTTTTLAPTNNTTYAQINPVSAANCPGLPVDSDGNPYIQMANGDVLKATFATALTASDQIIALAQCADF